MASFNAQTPPVKSKPTVKIPAPPKGKKITSWLGPAFLWMLSAAGSGELLFTPRIASLYGYALIWALLMAVTLKWFINREVGRFTVCTGATILNGFGKLPGPKNWAVWVILLPQLVVAVATVAGLAGAAATALKLVISIRLEILTIAITLLTAAVIFLGQYKSVEKIATYLAVILSLSVLAAALSVFPEGADLATGLVPQLPEKINYTEVLPWLGFMLAGAAGLMWYSYWVQARGYGAANGNDARKTIDAKALPQEEQAKLKGWVKLMTISNTLAVVGALLIAMAFLILGGELLRPEGLVPEEDKIAETLGKLLGNVWGQIGFWFMIGAIFVTFCSTILSDQDGFGRMFTDGTKLILNGLGKKGKWTEEKRLKKVFVATVLALIPIAVYLSFGDPVNLLKMAGVIEASHIPFVTGLTLYLNKRMLPAGLQPSKPVFIITALAGLFFIGFAGIYIYQLLSGSQ